MNSGLTVGQFLDLLDFIYFKQHRDNLFSEMRKTIGWISEPVAVIVRLVAESSYRNAILIEAVPDLIKHWSLADIDEFLSVIALDFKNGTRPHSEAIAFILNAINQLMQQRVKEAEAALAAQANEVLDRLLTADRLVRGEKHPDFTQKAEEPASSEMDQSALPESVPVYVKTGRATATELNEIDVLGQVPRVKAGMYFYLVELKTQIVSRLDLFTIEEGAAVHVLTLDCAGVVTGPLLETHYKALEAYLNGPELKVPVEFHTKNASPWEVFTWAASEIVELEKALSQLDETVQSILKPDQTQAMSAIPEPEPVVFIRARGTFAKKGMVGFLMPANRMGEGIPDWQYCIVVKETNHGTCLYILSDRGFTDGVMCEYTSGVPVSGMSDAQKECINSFPIIDVPEELQKVGTRKEEWALVSHVIENLTGVDLEPPQPEQKVVLRIAKTNSSMAKNFGGLETPPLDGHWYLATVEDGALLGVFMLYEPSAAPDNRGYIGRYFYDGSTPQDSQEKFVREFMRRVPEVVLSDEERKALAEKSTAETLILKKIHAQYARPSNLS